MKRVRTDQNEQPYGRLIRLGTATRNLPKGDLMVNDMVIG